MTRSPAVLFALLTAVPAGSWPAAAQEALTYPAALDRESLTAWQV